MIMRENSLLSSYVKYPVYPDYAPLHAENTRSRGHHPPESFTCPTFAPSPRKSLLTSLDTAFGLLGMLGWQTHIGTSDCPE